MNKIKKLVWYEKVFVWATIALLAFGIMGHFLGKLCGSYLDEWQTPPIDSIVSSLFFDKYPIYNGNIFKLRCYAIYIETDTENAEYRLKVIGTISEK